MRICDYCGKEMEEGYLYNYFDYFCENCVHEVFSDDDFEKLKSEIFANNEKNYCDLKKQTHKDLSYWNYYGVMFTMYKGIKQDVENMSSN